MRDRVANSVIEPAEVTVPMRRMRNVSKKKKKSQICRSIIRTLVLLKTATKEKFAALLVQVVRKIWTLA